MTSERGVRSNAMVVYLQVAIISGNERKAQIDAGLRSMAFLVTTRGYGTPFSCRQPQS